MNPEKNVPDSGSEFVSFSQTEDIVDTRGRRGMSKLIGEAKAYLVEYALVLILTGTLLGVVISMLNSILKYKPDEYGYFSSFAYTASICMIATLLVVIPLVLLLTKRTDTVEEANPAIKNQGWRKGFLGFFLLNVGLWGIGFLIAFSYDFVSFFASIGITDDNSFPWRSLLANSIAAIILGFTLWLYSQDYRNQETRKALMGKIHHYGLIGIAIVLTLIFMATTLKSQRASFIDDAISNDLNSIQTKISDYENDNKGRLPSDLSDVTLNDKQKARAKKYDYTYSKTSGGYELCAIFKTDTKSKDKGSQNPLDAFSGSSYSYDEPSTENSDPHRHEKGKQCFETKSYRNDYSQPDQPSNYNAEDQPLFEN